MKAVAYARFSSDNQREESITYQLRGISDKDLPYKAIYCIPTLFPPRLLNSWNIQALFCHHEVMDMPGHLEKRSARAGQ
ncbi:hypothetical protein [Neomoorella humiferrea]|uniref:hypothetical protein n=1 Tax=Neomoorella humiferrea TaxID=676965 RepID=UPI0030D1936B